MNTQAPIRFLITGGTIDSYYEGTKDTVVPYENSIIPDYVRSLKLYSETVFTQICMKDSRDIVAEDREALLKSINESPEKHFIITHGTYTMSDTARFLEHALTENKEKVVIITGSMIPLSIGSLSDGGFNLGYAISAVHSANPGVYVSMNGKLFMPEEVSKAASEGRFTSLFNR